MTSHAIHVEPTELGYRWQCSCHASGNAHASHQAALAFGLQHLAIMNDGKDNTNA